MREMIIAVGAVIVGLIAFAIGGFFVGSHHKEKTLEEKFHQFLDLATLRLQNAGSSVKSTVADYSSRATNTVKDSATAALHATEDEAAYLLRVAADKIGN